MDKVRVLTVLFLVGAFLVGALSVVWAQGGPPVMTNPWSPPPPGGVPPGRAGNDPGAYSVSGPKEGPPPPGGPPGDVPPPPPGSPGAPPVPPAPPGPGVPPEPPARREGPSLAYVQAALATARAVVPCLSVGDVWMTRGPLGEVDVQVPLEYEQTIVAILHINPTNGQPLPLGYPPLESSEPLGIEALQARVAGFLPELQVLGGAEYRAPERAWLVPVAWRGVLVAHLRVSEDGTTVMGWRVR